MKHVLIALVTIFLISCNNTPKDLEGIWIGAYDAEKNDKNDSLFIIGPTTGLFEINNDSIHFKTFRRKFDETIDTIKSYPYSFENNVLYFDNDSLVFQKITEDSLIVINNNNPDYRRTYKRVDIESSPDVEFANDLYAIQFSDWKDTLEFMDNGLVLRVNDRYVSDGFSFEWYISSYKKLKFFVVIGQFELPYLIDEVKENQIGIRFYYERTKIGSMDRLVDYENDRQLSGEWEMIKSKEFWDFLRVLKM